MKISQISRVLLAKSLDFDPGSEFCPSISFLGVPQNLIFLDWKLGDCEVFGENSFLPIRSICFVFS